MKINGSNLFAGAMHFPSATLRPQGRDVANPQVGGGKAAGAEEFSPQDEAELQKLKARDRQVRQHEQAHLSAAGGLATSGANYIYQKGPDGVNYAVGGEVGIDTSEGRTPEETLRRAQAIRAAALAPADPSSQDRAVAIQAQQMEGQANAEIASRRAAMHAGGLAADSAGRDGRRAEIERLYGDHDSRPKGSTDIFA